MHTDATQAVNYLNINVEKLGVDMLVFNGSKIYEYDIQMENSGAISTILKGPVVVVSDVTN